MAAALLAMVVAAGCGNSPVDADVRSAAVMAAAADGGTAAPVLRAYMKDDAASESNATKPRIYIENAGTVSVSDFVWYFELQTESGKVPVLDRWYPRDSTAITLESLGSDRYRVKFDFHVTLAPGERLPANDGYSIGLHYADWSAWDKSNDWSGNRATTFQLNDHILIVDRNGNPISGLSSLRPVVTVIDRGTAGVDTVINIGPATTTREVAHREVTRFVDDPRFGRSGLEDPRMPYMTYYVLLPQGATAVIPTLAASTQSRTEHVRAVLEQELGRPVNFNPSYPYEDRFYPPQVLSVDEVKQMRGMTVALVRVSPFQYNPVQDVLVVHENIQASYSFPGGVAFALPEGAAGTVVNNLVVNPQARPAGASFFARERGRMAIIATSAVAAAADELALWKRQMGYTVTVEARSSWSVDDVKAYLGAMAGDALPEYLLLMGDFPEIAAEVHLGDYWAVNERYVTDNPYALRDPTAGSWSDTAPDLAVARIATSSASEALAAVRKIIAHEKTPPAAESYYQRIMTAGDFQDDDDVNGYDIDPRNGYEDMRYAQTAWEIADYLRNGQSKTVDLLYAADAAVTPRFWNNGDYGVGAAVPAELLRSNGFAWDATNANVKTALNAGRMIAFYRGHGTPSGWQNPSFVSGDVAGLSNTGLLPLVLSINCSSGQYWDPNPLGGNTTSLADVLLTTPSVGAAAVVAATRPTYAGSNDAFALSLINAMWPRPGLRIWMPQVIDRDVVIAQRSPVSIDKLGFVLLQADLESQIAWSGSRLEVYELFGDPTMEVYTSTPPAIAAQVPSSIDVNAGILTVSGLDVTDGMITLTSGGRVTARVEIAGATSVTVPVTADVSAGDATLTITAKGRRPFIRTLTVSTANVPSLIDRLQDYAGYGAFGFLHLRVADVRDHGGAAVDVGAGLVLQDGQPRQGFADVWGATDDITVAADVRVGTTGTARKLTVFDVVNPSRDFVVQSTPAGLPVEQITTPYANLNRRFRHASFRLPDAVASRIASSASGPRVVIDGTGIVSHTMSTAQDYGQVWVNEKGTLIIPSGTYFVNELWFGSDFPAHQRPCVVRFSITNGQPVVIYTSRFGVSNGPEIYIDGGDASDVLIYADRETSLNMAGISDFYGTIVTPNGTVQTQARMHGQVIAFDVQLDQALEYIPFDAANPAGLVVSPQPAPAWGPLTIRYTLTAAQAGKPVVLRAIGDWSTLTRSAPNAAGANQVTGIYDWTYSSLGNRPGPFAIELLVDGAVVGRTQLTFQAL